MTATINTCSTEIVSAAGFDFSEPATQPEPDYSEWFRKNALQSRWLTFFAAFYIHWISILALAAVFLHAPIDFGSVALNAVISDSELMEVSSLEMIETAVDLSASKDATQETEALALSASTLIPISDQQSLDDMPHALAAMASITAAAEATESKSRKETAPKAPQPIASLPRNAVSAGSFSVWTVPENPDPGEPYKIIVQIRLPAGTQKYAVADLEGVVVGSDGYQKMIPGNVSGFLPVQDGHVRFEVHIVSADENVQDTVFVRSKVLREAQKIQLRF